MLMYADLFYRIILESDSSWGHKIRQHNTAVHEEGKKIDTCLPCRSDGLFVSVFSSCAGATTALFLWDVHQSATTAVVPNYSNIFLRSLVQQRSYTPWTTGKNQ